MTAIIPQLLSLGLSIPASASSATSSHTVLSRASSQTSLTSNDTTDSELSSVADVAPQVNDELNASSPVQRICFVGGGYVGE